MPENQSQAETVTDIDLFAYVEALWRYRRMILLLFFTAVTVAAALSFWVIPPTYEAISLVQVGQDPSQGSPQAGLGAPLSLGSPDAYRSIAMSEPVLSQLARATGQNVSALEARVLRAEIVPGANILRLVVKAESPKRAVAIGEAWQAAFGATVQAIQTDRLEQQLTVQRGRLEGLRRSWEDLQKETGSRPESARLSVQVLPASNVVAAAGEVGRLEQLKSQVSRGQSPDINSIAPFAAEDEPVAPRKAVNVAVAGVLALLVGTMGVFCAEAWRTRTSLMG